MDKLLIINKMKYLLFYALLLIAAMSYGQGFLKEEKVKSEPLKITKQYDATGSFYENLAWVTLNGKYGFIDKTGKEITSLEYDDVRSFEEGVAKVNFNNKWCFINTTGKEISSLYDELSDFSCNLSRVKLNNKYGFINKTGKEITSIRYYAALDF